MKPAIIIPTYWSSGVELGTPGQVQCYDHATPVDTDAPQLADCIASLEKVRGLDGSTVIILVVAPPTVEERAVHRVHEIVQAHPWLPQTVIVDSFKSMVINTVLADTLPAGLGEPVSLRGYGAIRNMGLVVCCAFGCDAAVFLDDDETVLDADFLTNAVYGFGYKDRSGMPILAKSGYFLDRHNSALANRRQAKAQDKHWAKRKLFNEWMTQALAGPRISVSPYLCGGCHALHAEAFTRVAYDPWITRGEDTDYLINLRLYGINVWFDNRWRVRHLPPSGNKSSARFLQDVYRWTYERRKLEICNTNIDLQKVAPADLMPYPGPWISNELPTRIRKTAFLYTLLSDEKSAYWQIYTKGRKDAEAYADEHCSRYLALQSVWARVTATAWLNTELSSVLEGDGMLNPSIANRMSMRPTQPGQLTPLEDLADTPVPVDAVGAMNAVDAGDNPPGN